MRISIDTETTGLDLHHKASPFFVTICSDDDPENPYYWEWDVDPETRIPKVVPSDLEEISEVLNSIGSEGEYIFHNAKFDVRGLSKLKLVKDWDWGRTHDTLYSAHLLASNQLKDLTTQAMIYLRVNIKPYEEALREAVMEARKIARAKYKTWKLAKEGLEGFPSIKGSDGVWSNDMWLPRAIALAEGYSEDHPWNTVLREYSISDSMVTLPLFEKHQQLIEEKELSAIYKYRRKLLPIVYSMESRGIPIHDDRLKELTEQYQHSSERFNRICVNLSGGNLTALSGGVTNELRATVFDYLKLVPFKKTDKGGNSLDKYVLDDWLAKLPQNSKQYVFVQNLWKYRKRATALSYNETYEKFKVPAGKGVSILHSSLNPVGTSTLRWSSQNPNEQQISKQEIEEFSQDEVEQGKVNRSARYMFGPEEGREWWSCDGQNLELRLPAYASGEQALIDLFEKPDGPPYFGSNHLLFFDILHPDKWDRNDPNGLKVAKKKYATTWYQWTKNGNFAVQYGAVAESGTADTAYHVPGAQKIIESRLTRIKAYSQNQIDIANEYGYVETMPDKTIDPERGYPLYCARSTWGKVIETIPLSYHIQGTAMWWMCAAMIRCQEFLDELNRKCKKPNQYRIALQIHDELVFDFPKGKGLQPWRTNYGIVQELRRLMSVSGDNIGIPTPVSCEYHAHNWQEGKSVSI